MPEEYRATKNWPYHISAGGAVYREQSGQRQYALLLRDSESGKPRSSWHLPKGTLYHNETLEAAATREIKEESGLDVRIEAYLGALQSQWFYKDRDIDKTTHYFLCRWQDGDGSTMNREHDALEWHSAGQAIEKLNNEPKNEAEIIRRAEKYLSA